MDKDYFMNAGIPPPPQQQLHFETTMPIPWSGLHPTAEQPPFSAAVDHQFRDFDSSLSSLVAASDAFDLRQLIGKLGGPTTIPPPVPSLAGYPGFAERAAKFSCFGSRSFNGRTTSPIGLRNSEPGRGSGNLLTRVASSPSLKQGGSSPVQVGIGPVNGPGFVPDKKYGSGGAESNEESSVSDQIPSGEMGSRASISNSRKRKTKTKEDKSNSANKEGNEEGNDKRSKQEGSGKINETKTEEEEEEEAKGGSKSNDESEKNNNKSNNQKPPEPPKDYIHVRARRGQATDSHSLAERVRREKISERMKLLQDLVPGCNKVTGKALMLDEIINYVQSLQRQVEFLSMKLASVNPGLDFNMENLLSKDMFQQNTSAPQQMYPVDSSAPAFYDHHQQNAQQLHNTTNISAGPMYPLSLDSPLNLGLQLHSLDGFNETLHQFAGFSEHDLQSIVQMGFVQNAANFLVPNQTSDMKIER